MPATGETIALTSVSPQRSAIVSHTSRRMISTTAPIDTHIFFDEFLRFSIIKIL